jgi:hypothetical protein
MGGPSRRALKRRADAGARAEIDGDGAHCTFTEAKEGPVRGRGYVPVPVGALEEPDGVKVKSAGMIKDSDSEYLS